MATTYQQGGKEGILENIGTKLLDQQQLYTGNNSANSDRMIDYIPYLDATSLLKAFLKNCIFHNILARGRFEYDFELKQNHSAISYTY